MQGRGRSSRKHQRGDSWKRAFYGWWSWGDVIWHNVDTRHSRRGWEVWAEPQQRGDCPQVRMQGEVRAGPQQGRGCPQVRMQGEAGLPLEAECQAEEFGLFAVDGTRRRGRCWSNLNKELSQQVCVLNIWVSIVVTGLEGTMNGGRFSHGSC